MRSTKLPTKNDARESLFALLNVIYDLKLDSFGGWDRDDCADYIQRRRMIRIYKRPTGRYDDNIR